jgi:hypothetical protein
MTADYESIHEYWDPWASIPSQYNLGVDLSGGQVAQGFGDKVAIHWENAVDSRRSLT